MPSHPIPTRRGGPRPGAGAPMGNLNALRTGRHSRRFPDAACYVRILPQLRHELDLAHEKSPAIAARRLAQLLHAAQHVLATDPDLIARLETAIFLYRDRLPSIPNGALALQLIITPRRPPYPRNLLAFCGWLIKRDPVFAEVLPAILLPALHAALAAQQASVQPQPDSRAESAAPSTFDCFPSRRPRQTQNRPRKKRGPKFNQTIKPQSRG